VAPLAAHLASHLQASRLDRELAGGVSPERRAELALRARRLRRERGRLARALRRIVRGERTGVPVVVEREAAPALALLASRLDAPTEVATAGVAQARLLVSDVRSPLYGDGDLEAAALRAVSACASSSAS
jgi:hypothetical protein